MLTNSNELFKFSRLIIVWLSIIFISVWAACYLFGFLIPHIILSMGSGDVFNFAAQLFQYLTPVIAILVFIPINAMFMVLVERRGLALFTVRMGPNRVGPDGLLQTAADAVKLLFKEDIIPTGADGLLFTLAPIIFFAPSIFGSIPLLAAITGNSDWFAITNLPTGIFFMVAASSVPVVGIVMGGWASNNKYSLVGGLRSAAQAISYEIPLVLSLLTICYLSQSLNVIEISDRQTGGFLNWNIFGGGALSGLDKYLAAVINGSENAGEILKMYYPQNSILTVIAVIALIFATVTAFFMYLTAACAEVNRIPFDLPEAESELVSGYNTEYSGIKFAIFFLAEFTNLFIVASIASVMFLGAGSSPIPQFVVDYVLTHVPAVSGLLNQLTALLSPLMNQFYILNPATFWSVFWMVIKTYSLVLFAVLVRGTLPRFKIDQLMDFSWKRLIPISLLVFFIAILSKGVFFTNV